MTTILLQAIVGSTAYGLAGPTSDVDRIGVYAAPTLALTALHPPTERELSIVEHEPSDRVLHEVGKACRLMLRCNPSVTELLWLPEDLYEVRTGAGHDLIGIRHAFLSAPRVRDAYCGYASAQFHRLANEGRFESTYRARTAKHARHVRRLLDQGLQLYSTGELTVRLADPARYIDFGERAAADPESVRPAIAEAAEQFDRVRSPLPEYPDEAVVEQWLLGVREAHLPRAR